MNSMLSLSACLCLLGLVALSEAYPNGPPVSTVTSLCTDMNPSSGHKANTQIIASSPFEVVTNQNCYKDALQIQVIVRTLARKDAKIAGLFVQARQSGSPTTLGTFDVVSDSVLSPLTCTGLASNSSVGHNKVEKTYYRSMLWTAPASFKGNIKFRATVVQSKERFWVGLESGMVTHSLSCVATAQISNTRGHGTSLQAAPYCLTLALLAFLMTIFAQ